MKPSLRLLINVTEVNTENQKWPKISTTSVKPFFPKMALPSSFPLYQLSRKYDDRQKIVLVQPVSPRALSLGVKTSKCEYKIMTTPKLSPKLGNLLSKFYCLIVKLLFGSTNCITIQFGGIVVFKSSTLNVYCLSSGFVHQKQKQKTLKIFFLCPLWTQ